MISRKILSRCLLITFAVIPGMLAAGGRVVRGYEVLPTENRTGITLTVDSIDFRRDLTRIYGSLNGQPNTAQRLDSIMLSLSGLKVMQADDIDGVDMQRWFQWEESGLIPVEIDFGPIGKSPREMIMRAVTPRGTVVWTIRHKPAAHDRR